jgi:CBS domain-containing protein
MDKNVPPLSPPIGDEDIYRAMQDLEGYIDISPTDFKEIFSLAYRHALERLLAARRAADIMHRPAHCLTTAMDLKDAAAFLATRNISGAPVVDSDGRVVGVVSEKDFLRRMGLAAPASFMEIIARCLNHQGCIAVGLRNHRVEEIMSSPAITAGPEIGSHRIATIFAENNINRLPIVDGQQRPLGIVSRTDLVNAFGEGLCPQGSRDGKIL